MVDFEGFIPAYNGEVTVNGEATENVDFAGEKSSYPTIGVHADATFFAGVAPPQGDAAVADARHAGPHCSFTRDGDVAECPERAGGYGQLPIYVVDDPGIEVLSDAAEVEVDIGGACPRGIIVTTEFDTAPLVAR